LPPNIITNIVDTLTELRRMHQLNLELLEQLSISCSSLMENNVQIPNANAVCSLLVKAKALIDEIQAETPKILQYRILSDDSYHDSSNRRKVNRTCLDGRLTNGLGGNESI